MKIVSWYQLNDSLPDKTNESDNEIANEPEHEINSLEKTETESSVESGKLDLRFQAYNEDLVICGSKGSGKSYLANELLKSFNNITCIVWDYNFQFHDARSMLFHTLDELLEVFDQAKRGRYILQPYDKSQQAFEDLCDAVFERGNCVLFLDELHLFT